MILKILKRSKKEVIFKVFTSFFIRIITLISPLFWSAAIEELSSNNLKLSFKILFLLVILMFIYYIISYFNQVCWYNLYNKIYINIYLKINPKNIKLSKFINISNNDIDIVCNFIGNIIIRIMELLEVFVIFIYFYIISRKVFLITCISFVFVILILVFRSKDISFKNTLRKKELDKKISYECEVYNKYKNINYIANRYLEKNTLFNLEYEKIKFITVGIMDIIKYFVIIYIIVYENANIGNIILIYSYYDKILTNLETLNDINTEYQSYKVSLNRIKTAC